MDILIFGSDCASGPASLLELEIAKLKTLDSSLVNTRVGMESI